MTEPDTRPQCPQCGKRLGRAEATAGICIWCQRINAANAAARDERNT